MLKGVQVLMDKVNFTIRAALEALTAKGRDDHATLHRA